MSGSLRALLVFCFLVFFPALVVSLGFFFAVSVGAGAATGGGGTKSGSVMLVYVAACREASILTFLVSVTDDASALVLPSVLALCGSFGGSV